MLINCSLPVYILREVIAWVKTKNLERGVNVVRAKSVARAMRQRRKFLNVISHKNEWMQEARQTIELYICVRFGLQSILRMRVIWNAIIELEAKLAPHSSQGSSPSQRSACLLRYAYTPLPYITSCITNHSG